MNIETWHILLLIAALFLANKLIGDSKKKKEQPTTPVVQPQPNPAPVDDNRVKLIVDTDMGPTSDPDDVQCYLAQAADLKERYNVRGVIGTSIRGTDSSPFIETVMSELGVEFPVYGGARNKSRSTLTPGAKLIVEEARKASPQNKLLIHVWGPITTLAQAIQHDPSIVDKISVYFIASWNRDQDQPSFDSLKKYANKMEMWIDEQAFRAMMRSGDTGMLNELDRWLDSSKAGTVYKKYPIPPKDATFAGKWKGGDLTAYLLTRNVSLRDRIFTNSSYGSKWKVADGNSAEKAMASSDVRRWWIDIVKINVNKL